MGIKLGLAGVGIMLLAGGCIESAGYPDTSYGNSGYGYYGNGQPAYYPAYSSYAPQPTVITQTRYVPVPVATPHEYRRTDERSREARKDDRHDDHRKDNHDHDADADRLRH